MHSLFEEMEVVVFFGFFYSASYDMVFNIFDDKSVAL